MSSLSASASNSYLMESDSNHCRRSKNNNSNSSATVMLGASFNQDGSCVALALENGFEIYNITSNSSSGHNANKNQEENNDCTVESSVRRILSGGIGQVELLFRCNLMALVGGSRPESNLAPYCPTHRVLIWDDSVQKAIGELSFRQLVLAVKLRRDAIAVALLDRTYLYHLADLSLRDKIYTAENPHGLLGLNTSTSGNSSSSSNMMGGAHYLSQQQSTTSSQQQQQQQQDMILACPSVTNGHVRVELYGYRKTVLLEAHESSLRALALTEDGHVLATASIKGTVIRVWQVLSSTCVAEFRRGVERVDMTCLAWSWDHAHLACCSDKGTVHVFEMPRDSLNNNNTTSEDASTTKKKKSSFLSSLGLKSSSSSSRRQMKSICQIRGISNPLACAFCPDVANTLAIVGWDMDGNGVLLLSQFDNTTEPTTRFHILAPLEENQVDDETEGQRRRKRLLGGGKRPTSKQQNKEEETLYIGERLEVLENEMKNIEFEEDDGGFLNISGFQVVKEKTKEEEKQDNEETKNEEETKDEDSKQEEN